MSTAPLITIFVRHAADCKYKGDEFAKRCQCRKHFRWSQHGEQHRRKAGTRSWVEAEEQKRKLEDQLAGRKPEPGDDSGEKLIETAITTFKRDKAAQGLAESTCLPYNLELKRFQQFCAERKPPCLTVSRIDLELLVDYRGTWLLHYPASSTRALVQTRLRHFLRFCYDAGWLPKVPRLKAITVDEPETMPLDAQEYERLLKGTESFPLYEHRIKVRALIQLMRWSGLAVRDASNLPTDALIKTGDIYHVPVSRQKTKKKLDVTVPIPNPIAADLLKVSAGESLIFKHSTRKGSEASHAHYMGQLIKQAFEYAGIQSDGHMISHRLRDTFAVCLLEKGVPLEDVSKLLGHKSIRTTERHYAKWVKSRQDRLDTLVTGTWAHDTIPA